MIADEERALTVLIVLMIVVLVGGFTVYAVYEFFEKQNAVSVTLKELVVNKRSYEGKYVRVEGTLVKCLEENYRIWFITMPMVISTGKINTVSVVLIPVSDKYYVYSLTDGNYTIAILSEVSLEQYLGSRITVVGKVDGVKNANGDVLDYVINAEVVGG